MFRNVNLLHALVAANLVDPVAASPGSSLIIAVQSRSGSILGGGMRQSAVEGRTALIHIVNPFWNANGGSERRAIGLFEQLSGRADTRLWSTVSATPALRRQYSVSQISLWRHRFPKGGTLVVVGVYFPIGYWLRFARLQRVVLVYNTPNPRKAEKLADKIRRWTGCEPEWVYASQAAEAVLPYPGEVHLSPIDIAAFRHRPQSDDRQRADKACFTVGRLSRDVPEKHHQDDPALYRQLAHAGCQIRILGGNVLLPELGNESGITLYPEGAIEAREFLAGLDCVFYRTADHWYETFGRVVIEAMASGLPVVCGARGGYADIIEHGVNGFLVESNEQAFEILTALRRDPSLRERIGDAAVRTVTRLYAANNVQKQIDFYLRSGAALAGNRGG